MEKSMTADSLVPPTLRTGALVFSRTFPPISRHTLALFAGASGDHNPIHVDIDFARLSGFDDVFAHGMLVMAYLGQTLEQAGPLSGLKEFSTRFVSITQLGAQLTCTGSIASVEGELVALALRAADQNGDLKLEGRAVVDRKLWSDCLSVTI